MAKRKGNGSAEGHRNAADINNPGPERVCSIKESARGGPDLPGQGRTDSFEENSSDDPGSSSAKHVQKKDVAKAYEKYAE